jgi:CheY-like chemotaxis protein
VVDDDEDVADTYALWLDGEYDVAVAYSGEEAIEAVDDAVDVVLLDRRMPEVPGDEVLSHIRASGIDCRVSMLTAVEPDSDLVELPFDEYLVKPVTRDDVVEAVEDLLLRDSLEDDAQEYLAMQSAAEALEDRDGETVRDPAAVEGLRERLVEMGASEDIRAQVERLQRRKALDGLIRSVNRTVVRVDSREELEAALCERFVEETDFECAVVGEYTETYERFIPGTASGETGPPDSLECDAGDPVRAAVADATVQAVPLAGVPGSSVARLAETFADRTDDLLRTAVVVPVVHRETPRGAVVLLTTRETALEDAERDALAEVGATVGNAVESLQTREIVHADTVVEVELGLTDRADVLVDLSATRDCRVQLAGLNLSSAAGAVCYLTVSGVSADDALAFLVEKEAVTTCRVIDDRGDESLVECTLHGSSVLLKLLSASANVTNFLADGGQGHVTLEVPPGRNLRSVVGAVEDAFEGVDLLSKRTADRAYQSIEGFRSTLEDELTDRQHEAVSAAHSAGYFEWPRESTAEEVAEALELAAPTFHEHLREAQRKLVDVYLDERE